MPERSDGSIFCRIYKQITVFYNSGGFLVYFLHSGCLIERRGTVQFSRAAAAFAVVDQGVQTRLYTFGADEQPQARQSTPDQHGGGI
jgi:hypothetical protein